MTLDEFIASRKNRRFPGNAWVTESGFSDLYVRMGDRYIDGELLHDVLDLANMTAASPGDGAFKRLVKRLAAEYPDVTLYVENVMTARFGDGLARMGFKRLGDCHPFSYVMRARDGQ